MTYAHKIAPSLSTFGLIKSGLDAHTLGIIRLAQLLEECGFKVHVADADLAHTIDHISKSFHFEIFKKWIFAHYITHVGFSYRLDPHQAQETFRRLVILIDRDKQLSPLRNGQIQDISFAGLPESCQLVEKEFGKRFQTFRGDETPKETLLKLGVSEHLIPKSIQEQCTYDEMRLSFGKDIVERELAFQVPPIKEYSYSEYGTPADRLIFRLDAAQRLKQLPLTRVHAGPYLKDREEALALFSDWLKKLSIGRFLDIISVGSSQLSQSHFGEDWNHLPNGGGIPFNSELELRVIREDAVPMLVRAYSATNNIPHVARILEKNLNMAWHALSFWWFNQLDGRGPLHLRDSIRQQIKTLEFIASVNKPYEPNTPHHFAFRGSDDVTYVASAYLAARAAKQNGIRCVVLQNMLNTPKSTSGLMDLSKSRALLNLVKGLEDSQFRVIYQPRAGLDYFSPDTEKAKAQLAAVTALMADVKPRDPTSPEIVHVVSYSEALFLATPEVINESVRITKAALSHYPAYRGKNTIVDLIESREVKAYTHQLQEEARLLIKDMEKTIKGLYTSRGLFRVFQMGYFPVPYLWECREEFKNAVNWTTKPIEGGVGIVDDTGSRMTLKKRLQRIRELNSTQD